MTSVNKTDIMSWATAARAISYYTIYPLTVTGYLLFSLLVWLSAPLVYTLERAYYIFALPVRLLWKLQVRACNTHIHTNL